MVSGVAGRPFRAERRMEPVVVLLMPRFTDAVAPSARLLDNLEGIAIAVGAYGTAEERASFLQAWETVAYPPLLLFRRMSIFPSDLIEVMTQVAREHPLRPIAILLADGPELLQYKEEGRDVLDRQLALRLHATLPDLQVFLYSGSWASRPPRIR